MYCRVEEKEKDEKPIVTELATIEHTNMNEDGTMEKDNSLLEAVPRDQGGSARCYAKTTAG